MNTLEERIKWLLIQHRGADAGLIARRILQEVESTHRVVDPEVITEDMLQACFCALPKHYDPPDPKRRLWHGYKARHRYAAMVKAAPRIVE